MAKGLTSASVRRAVQKLAKEAKDRSKTHEEWVDNVTELVDKWWGDEMATGEISKMSPYPGNRKEVDLLRDIAVIFDEALENGWGVETDTGLWEGLHPYPAIVAQAYFTLQSAVLQQEPTNLL